MKKIILSLLMSFMFSMAPNAQAQECYADGSCYFEESCCAAKGNFYARLLGGVNFLQNTKINGNRTSYDPGYIIAASVGYHLQYGLSVEAEYAFRRNDIHKTHYYTEGSSNSGHFETSSWMANMLWNLPLSSWGCNCWNIQPFIGAGIGYDFQQMRSSNCRVRFKQDWRHFSWQLMAGLAYPIFCNTNLTVEYAFHQGGSHFNNHSLGAGLVYKF